VARPGVYISWPFCAQKCTYCNFASGVFSRELEHQYLDALLREMEATGWTRRTGSRSDPLCAFENQAPDTVYLGGGTPSRIAAADLERILDAVPGRPWREATIEAAPGAIDAESAACWRELGITRVSLGVQSFDSAELARTGRRHTSEMVARDVDTLRRAGIGNFNIDLIAGLPGQTAKSWSASLEWIERIEAPHVSIYMLEVDEDSRLGREVLFHGIRYGAQAVPPDDEIAGMYETAVERLAALGLARYEISNFARPGCESLHNLKYWRLEPYIGFGADAHSFDGQWRWQNVESVEEYVKRPRPEESRVRANLSEERFFVGLRLMEGIQPEAGHEMAISRFLREGLLEHSGSRLRLTNRGVLLSNEVLQEFIECPTRA
jgi:oxygen-independent coproporphyrinogen-3 oxidase